MTTQKTSWPIIGQDDINSIMKVIDNRTFVKGPFSKQLSEEFSNFIGIKHCQTVSSCTHAIHLALQAADIGPGSEVLVPNFTYVGSVSPIVNAGAKPVFVDINPVDYNLSIDDALEKLTSRTKAIIPVHLHGYPCDIKKIRTCMPNLVIIEDACQAHGASRAGKYTGTMGDIGCFSLNQVKTLCGGQGGLITTNNEKLWKNIVKLSSPGMKGTVGLSYEITEFSAALALSQLRKLTDIIKKANTNFKLLTEKIKPELKNCIPPLENDVVAVWHKLRIKLMDTDLNTAIKMFTEKGVPHDTWPYSLVSQRSEYEEKYGKNANTPYSESAIKETIVLGNEKYPFHAQNEDVINEWINILNINL